MYSIIPHGDVDPETVMVLGARDKKDGFFVSWCLDGSPGEAAFRTDFADYDIVLMNALEVLDTINSQAEHRTYQ